MAITVGQLRRLAKPPHKIPGTRRTTGGQLRFTPCPALNRFIFDRVDGRAASRERTLWRKRLVCVAGDKRIVVPLNHYSLINRFRGWARTFESKTPPHVLSEYDHETMKAAFHSLVAFLRRYDLL
jgi:hypothetical protein